MNYAINQERFNQRFNQDNQDNQQDNHERSRARRSRSPKEQQDPLRLLQPAEVEEIGIGNEIEN